MLTHTLKAACVCVCALLVTGGWVAETGRPAVNLPPCLVADSNPDPPVYYAVDLVTTRKVRGARRATGTGNVTYVPSPFGVSISQTGTYVYNVDISLEKIDPPSDGRLVAWITSTDLSDIRLIGALDESFQASGRIDLNRFLVVITLEPAGEEIGPTWQGPVVLRGMSRSGFMHTKAGHGPFQTENCASYGYS